jgi:hypothetical protein
MLAVGHVLTGVPPEPGASADDVLRFVSSNTGLHRTQVIVSVLGLLPLTVFIAGLLMPFRASDAEHNEGWATSILIGAVALIGSVAAGDGLLYSLFLSGGEGLDAAVVRGLWDAQYVTYAGAGLAVAVATGSTAIPVMRYRVWPRWHGWLSIFFSLLGILSVIDIVSTATGGLFHGLTIVGFSIVWVLATSILLFRTSTYVKTKDTQPVS